jgi:FkbM family methyltransferase
MFAALGNVTNFLARHPLTRTNRLAAFSRYARWQIESRLRDEIVVNWVEDTRLAVRRGMTGATGNIYAGLHEFHDMAFALHFLRAGDVFADVGANVGSYTILASGVARAHTIAFEPDPGTAERLHRNVQLNGISDLVSIHVAAVGENAGSARFSIDRDTENHVVTTDEGTWREVPIESLDTAVGERIPALIKIDVEGYEAQVLRGARRVLADSQLQAVLTENRSGPVLDMLASAGLHEVAYDGFGRKLLAPGAIPMANALFLRDADFVQSRVTTAKTVSVLRRSI